MTQQDPCPNSDTNVHRYFVFKVVDVFEPYQRTDPAIPVLYEKVEYALLGCNCGSTLKQRVEQK